MDPNQSNKPNKQQQPTTLREKQLEGLRRSAALCGEPLPEVVKMEDDKKAEKEAERQRIKQEQEERERLRAVVSSSSKMSRFSALKAQNEAEAGAEDKVTFGCLTRARRAASVLHMLSPSQQQWVEWFDAVCFMPPTRLSPHCGIRSAPTLSMPRTSSVLTS